MPPSKTKPCSICGAPERLSGQSRCRPCDREYQNQRRNHLRANDPEWAEKEQQYQKLYHKGYHLQRSFGLSVEDFEAMLDAQGFACAICRNEFTKTPNVDHNHDTGVIRGLLCVSCNMALGLFKDDPERVETAARYLRAN